MLNRCLVDVTPRLKAGATPAFAGTGETWVLFPWAGGSSMALRKLAAALQGRVVAIELPGRARRSSEPVLTSFEEAVRHVEAALLAHGPSMVGSTFSFFGYSFGGLLSYAVAQRLREGGHPCPRRMVVGATLSPRLVSLRTERWSEMSEEAFIEYIASKGGTPRELLENKQLMAMFLPSLRGDYALLESSRGAVQDEPRPRCAMLGLCGAEDASADPERMLAGWEGRAEGGFELQTFTGGHFFLLKHVAEVAAAMLAFARLEDEPSALAPRSRTCT